MITLVLFLRLAFSDASALGHDSFDVRQAAQARLARLGVLGLPAAAMARAAGNADAHHRAGRLLAPWALAAFDGVQDLRELRLRLIALWLFYGPAEFEQHGYRRFLRTAGPTAAWAKSGPPADMLRLVGLARRWGLLEPWCITMPEVLARNNNGLSYKWGSPDAYWAWINVVRWRAIGVKRFG